MGALASLAALAQEQPDPATTPSAPLPEVTPPAETPGEPVYRAPAPPVDSSDSQRAMAELDDVRVIEVGDQIEYMVLEDREAPEIILVDEDGDFQAPLLGKFPAVGKTARGLAFEISEALKKDYYHQATVVIAHYRDTGSRGIVYVMGEVTREGAVEIPSGEILRASGAIMRAGGFTIWADPTRVMLIRPDVDNPENSQRFEINVGEILETGRLDKDLVVKANDRVFVGRRGDTSGQFVITGAVRNPGVYPIAVGQKITISQAVLGAGGFAEFANGGRVKHVRFTEEGERIEQEIDVEEIMEEGRTEQDILLLNGDRVIIPEKFISF